MKNCKRVIYYTILLVVLLHSNLPAQVNDYALSEGFITEATAATRLAGNRWLVTGSGRETPDAYFDEKLPAFILDDAGNVLYQTNLYALPSATKVLKTVIALPDSGFVVIVESTQCDVGGKMTLARYDAYGQKRWHQSEGWQSSSPKLPEQVRLTPDTNLIGLANAAVTKYSLTDGSVLWQDSYTEANCTYNTNTNIYKEKNYA